MTYLSDSRYLTSLKSLKRNNRSHQIHSAYVNLGFNAINTMWAELSGALRHILHKELSLNILLNVFNDK